MRDNFFSTVGEILKYGGSTFAALIAASLYTATDSYFIGNWVGTDGLGAMAMVFPATMIFTALSKLFEIGGSAVVSAKIGTGQQRFAEDIMRTNYICAFAVGIVVAVVGNILLEPALRFIADNPAEHEIVDLAITFLRIALWGLPFLLTGLLTQTFMRCIGKPQHVFFMVAICTLTNIILDALFIIVFHFGMEGAAVATVIAQIFGAVISLWYFKYSAQKFSTPWHLAGGEYLWQEWKIGAGFAVADVMMCFIEYFLNAVLLHHDAAHLLAAASIVNAILSFIYLPLNGLDVGVQPLVSKLLRRKKSNNACASCVMTLS